MRTIDDLSIRKLYKLLVLGLAIMVSGIFIDDFIPIVSAYMFIIGLIIILTSPLYSFREETSKK